MCSPARLQSACKHAYNTLQHYYTLQHITTRYTVALMPNDSAIRRMRMRVPMRLQHTLPPLHRRAHIRRPT